MRLVEQYRIDRHDSRFAACAAWEADPPRVLGHPKVPKYLPKQGRNLVTYTE